VNNCLLGLFEFALRNYVDCVALCALLVDYLASVESLLCQVIDNFRQSHFTPALEVRTLLQEVHHSQVLLLMYSANRYSIVWAGHYSDMTVGLALDSGCSGFVVKESLFSEVFAVC